MDKPKRITLKQINKALKEAGINAELFHCRGYWYFQGPDFDRVHTQGVYGVLYLRDLSVQQWVNEARRLMNDQ